MNELSLTLNNFRQWIKAGDHPIAKKLFSFAIFLRCIEIPAPRFLFKIIWLVHQSITRGMIEIIRVFYWTPIFKSRVQAIGSNLYLYSGMPLIIGPLKLDIGNNVRLSGQTTLIGRNGNASLPTLKIGSNVDIGWQSTIAVGRKVKIGNNVRIAGRAFLAGYPGHPENPKNRAKGLPDTVDQIGDIVLEDDVWLATGVTVIAGVKIGRGSIIAAGSVVTKDIPEYVLAGGCPARIIKAINH